MSVHLLKPCYCPCLEILLENFSFSGNKHLDSIITAWKLWSPRLTSARTLSNAASSLCSSLLQSIQKALFSVSLTFAGYQPVLTGQQGFQGLMGVQQSSHGQGVMSSQQGTPVQGVMVSYPTMSSYQVRAYSWKRPGHKLPLSRANTTGHSLGWAVSRVMDAWPVRTSVDLDWDIGEKVCRCHSKCLGFPILNWICSHITSYS